MARELGPLMTAIVLVGRVGAAFTAGLTGGTSFLELKQDDAATTPTLPAEQTFFDTQLDRWYEQSGAQGISVITVRNPVITGFGGDDFAACWCRRSDRQQRNPDALHAHLCAFCSPHDLDIALRNPTPQRP